MKMKYLLTTSALAVGLFLGTQVGQTSHIPPGDLQKNPPSVMAGTSTLPDSLEGKKRPLSEVEEVEGTENAIVLAKRPRLSAEEGQAGEDVQATKSIIKEFYDLLTESDGFLNGFFRENLFPFLSSEDLNKFSLVSKTANELVRRTRMISDPRRLQEKVWIGGPERGTWVNYVFNAKLWEVMQGLLLMSLDKLNSGISRSYEKDVARTIPWLKAKFSNYNVNYILEDLEKVYNFLPREVKINNPNPVRNRIAEIVRGENTLRAQPSRLLRNNAKDKSNKPERELLTLINYILFSRECKFSPYPYPGTVLLKHYKNKDFFDPTKSLYFDLADTPDQMGLLERLFKVEERFRSLQPPHQKTPEEVARDWDFILQEAPYITRDYNYRSHAISAYLEVKDYTKVANVIEKIFERDPQMWAHHLLRLSVDDCREIAKKSLELKKYSFAAELYEKIFQRCQPTGLARFFTGYNTPTLIIDDYKNAAKAFFYAKNYSRTAELCEEILRKYPQNVTVNNYRVTAIAHYYAKNYDRAAELWEKVFDNYPQDVRADDYTRAIEAHTKASRLSRVAELQELLRAFKEGANLLR